MRLIKKLLGYLDSGFEKDPAPFLALRLRYDGGMRFSIADCNLSTVVTGGSGKSISVDLTQYTIAQLAAYLNGLPGYSVPYIDSGDGGQLSARALIDGEGDISKSNGDHINAYTNLAWAYMDAQASELKEAGDQANEMLEQMSTKTADAEWLDELGSYYAVPRNSGESDALYGPRIITTVLMPRSNNIAIEIAIEQISNGVKARIIDAFQVTDDPFFYDGAATYNGSRRYGGGTSAALRNLFDAEFDIDFNSDSFDTARISQLIEKFRGAGNFLRQISLSGTLNDSVDQQPTDYTSSNAQLGAVGGIGSASTFAPTATVTGAVIVAASGATGATAAPAGSAQALAAGSASALGAIATVAAPTATVRAGAIFSAPAAMAIASAPTGSAAEINEEMLAIEISTFMETYVPTLSRKYDGSFNYDGSNVYDSGEETFEVNIITA